MQQQPACWLLCCEQDGTTLPFPLVWPRAALDKEEAAGLEVRPSLSSAATHASSGNELETQSTNSSTDSAPAVSRLQSQKGGLPCGSSLQTSSPRAQSVAAMGGAVALPQLGATMPSTKLRDAPHLYHRSRSSGSPWYHQAGLAGAEEQVCSQLG